MGKTLEEYAAQHPQQEPERERQAIADTARSYQDRQQEREAVEQLKASIAQQMQEGNAPQYILYQTCRKAHAFRHCPCGSGYARHVDLFTTVTSTLQRTS